MAATGSLCHWSHRWGRRLGGRAGLGLRSPTLPRIIGRVDQMRGEIAGARERENWA